jgi:hypothetical protein
VAQPVRQLLGLGHHCVADVATDVAKTLRQRILGRLRDEGFYFGKKF